MLHSPSSQPYNLTNKNRVHYSQASQSQCIDDILGGMKNGFFVECGAADGETLSNSLFFEKTRNWTGILIEANPAHYSQILKRHRKAFSLQACLSPGNFSKVMNFKPVGFFGGINGTMDETHLKSIIHAREYKEDLLVQCFPLHVIMEALGRTHIHYFSLDVEGPEMDILRTIPWGKLRIDTLSVEYTMWSGTATNVNGSLGKLKAIREYIGSKLYQQVAILPKASNTKTTEAYGIDVIFKRKDLSKKN